MKRPPYEYLKRGPTLHPSAIGTTSAVALNIFEVRYYSIRTLKYSNTSVPSYSVHTHIGRLPRQCKNYSAPLKLVLVTFPKIEWRVYKHDCCGTKG